MPLQNRVQPTGEIIVDHARGDFTGNRGIIHRADKTLGASRWSHHAWICCTLDWQSRRRPLMTGRNWTELFFLDEAVAMAVGHRPCGYCRRAAYNVFTDAWTAHAGHRPKAPQMDKALHQARVISHNRAQIRHKAPINTLPNGTMIMRDDGVYLVRRDTLHRYQRANYAAPTPRPQLETVTVLTPQPMIDVLLAGMRPALHPSADLL